MQPENLFNRVFFWGEGVSRKAKNITGNQWILSPFPHRGKKKQTLSQNQGSGRKVKYGINIKKEVRSRNCLIHSPWVLRRIRLKEFSSMFYSGTFSECLFQERSCMQLKNRVPHNPAMKHIWQNNTVRHPGDIFISRKVQPCCKIQLWGHF